MALNCAVKLLRCFSLITCPFFGQVTTLNRCLKIGGHYRHLSENPGPLYWFSIRTTFLFNYFKNRLSNAESEVLNNKIRIIKASARGFHRFDSYRIRILFYCAKLNMAIN
uniref:transposase n=1 Tax=Chlorobium limicola TaxID=1092 RepID=UPI0029528A3E|nr:transposase [Chlorobium limicola]